jgi:16S rRNA (cytosine1402-N4)-methyltransferase
MMAGHGAPQGAVGGPARHIPVLLSEMLEALAPKDGGRYIDGTFGAGGYSAAILDRAESQLLAIDRDPNAIEGGQPLVARFAPRLILAQGRFGALDEIAQAHGFVPVDGVVLDVGVSSMQLDEAARGFSFRGEGPLDMRMEGQGESAGDLVNAADEGTLADILYHYGEERRSRAIARAIVAARESAPIRTTGELAAIIERVMPRRRPGDIHPATRSFQALRIAVNRELDELAAGLAAAERVLVEGGRLVVVSFHSLEDRIVKRFLAARSRAPSASRHQPQVEGEPATFSLLTRGVVGPSVEELAANPRARSARLRAAARTAAPARPLDPEILRLARPDALAALGDVS